MKEKQRPAAHALLALLIAAGVSPLMANRAAAAEPSTPPVPIFAVDTHWPQLPNGWVLGNVSKISVDRNDNVWLIHRPRTVPAGKTPAPPVVELDANGKFVRGWGRGRRRI